MLRAKLPRERPGETPLLPENSPSSKPKVVTKARMLSSSFPSAAAKMRFLSAVVTTSASASWRASCRRMSSAPAFNSPGPGRRRGRDLRPETTITSARTSVIPSPLPSSPHLPGAPRPNLVAGILPYPPASIFVTEANAVECSMMSILGKRRGGLEVYQQIMQGAEPFHFGGNEIGALATPGFTGTTQSVGPLGEALAEEGFTVIGPRLEGHGTSMENHASSTASDWISSIEAGLTWLQQRTSQDRKSVV